MKYRFDDFLLDTDLAEFRRQSIEVPLEPQAYSLLCLLIEARDRVLCKDEIIDNIWKGRIITDTALSTLVKTLRHSIGDSGARQRLVKTIRGRGFRFVGDVKAPSPRRPNRQRPMRPTGWRECLRKQVASHH